MIRRKLILEAVHMFLPRLSCRPTRQDMDIMAALATTTSAVSKVLPSQYSLCWPLCWALHLANFREQIRKLQYLHEYTIEVFVLDVDFLSPVISIA